MQCWREYWQRVADRRAELGAELYVVFNGDAVEGDHHKTTQIMSANPNAQAAAWNAAISVPLDLKQAAIETFALAYRQRTHIGEKSSSMGGQVTQAFDMSDMPPRAINVFNQYRRLAR